MKKFLYSNLKKDLQSNKISSEELCNSLISRIENLEPKINAFLRFSKEKILESARESDNRRKSNRALSEFDGIPIGIKDNICIRGEITSCSSKILENYISPYNATVIEKLLSKGFILFPGLNMDEFAMGSSTENSAFQVTKNPFDIQRIPGGSSGGSAAAVAASMIPIALGSDTGGSIRQPASLCGVFGLKPTYGSVSRYGLVAYASSLDQIGPISNDLEGIKDIYNIISGIDPKDSTSIEKPSNTNFESIDISKLRIGIMQEGDEWEISIKNNYKMVCEKLTSLGAKLVPLDFSLHNYSIPIYYIIATSECSSNLSRFDGIRYGLRENTSKLEDLYLETRTKGFGNEVKRRILLGTYSLSSGYYDAYYGKAQKARVMIRKSYEEFFQNVDLILQPTSPTTAFKIGEKSKDPVQMYKADILTTSVNLAGLPAMSYPSGLDDKGLPIGMQITAPAFHEDLLFQFTELFSKFSEFQVELPETIK
jgi:aspartyl-tRNA(Asn)/glutamyl-tRNA(Gln) amidotransferase subunit A